MKSTVVALLVCFSICFAAKIGQLPGYNGPELSQYTGYITLDEATNDNRFYWLVESTASDPSSMPLIIWFQGGPGCSGLIGLFTENGPYRPYLMENGTQGVMYNNIAWTNFANILYLEQPTGVGFSYSDSPSDYTTNDTKAALDNFAFLEAWLEEFPQYKNTPTHLAGESYGGVYIPTLTATILDNPNSQIASQLVGFTIGNPVISCKSADYNAIQFDLFYWHGLVSYSQYAAWTGAGCNFDSNLPNCNEILNETMNQIGYIYQQKRDSQDGNEPNLDPDDLYQDFCTGNGTLQFAVDQGYPGECYPVGAQMGDYLNRADVQDFIGANPIQWNECAGNDFNYTMLGESMIPNYQRFFDVANLSIMIYSGDVDVFTVPFGYTSACLNELSAGEEPQTTWGPWYVNGATAGYYEQYSGYTFATVKGAGHEAPQYQPLTTYELISRFIAQGSPAGGRPPSRSYVPITQARILKRLGVKG